MGRPSVLPSFATAATYPAGASPWSSQPPRVAPSGGMLAQGFTPQTDMPAEYMNYLLGLLGDWSTYLDGAVSAGWFGNGFDGSATLDGTATVTWASKVGSVYTLTRDTALVNLTVTGAGVILKTANFRLIGKGTLTTAAGGKVNNDAPSSASSNVNGPAAGSVGRGSDAALGVTNANGNNGASTTNGGGGPGGVGGAGTNAAGNGGPFGGPSASLGSMQSFTPQTLGYLFSYANPGVWTQLQGGSGGGSGGCSAGTGVSGAGAAGGGVCVVAFRVLALANATDISCAGGQGGNAVAGTSAAVGGGGGGGGGLLILIYVVAGASTFTAAANCPGGLGGTATGTGVAGTAGNVGGLIQMAMP